MSDGMNPADEWRKIVAGDKDTFRRLVEPHLEDMRSAADHEITYRVCSGDIGSGSLSSEDLVAETLIRAWDERLRKPDNLDLKAWLFGMLYRTADLLVNEERQVSDLAPISLDAPATDEEAAMGWKQPVDFESWDEVIPDPRTNPEEIAAAVEGQPGALSDPARRILLMHDRHGISLPQAAFVTMSTVLEARELLLEARQTILD